MTPEQIFQPMQATRRLVWRREGDRIERDEIIDAPRETVRQPERIQPTDAQSENAS